MENTFIAYNGPMVTTAGFVGVTTGTAIKTLLQIATPAAERLSVIEWGISFDGNAAGVPIKCELVSTGAIAATVTAHVAAGVQPYADSGAPASAVSLGVAATGYTASAEGAITASRYGDLQFVAPTSQYVKQYPLGREFMVPASSILRVRVTAAAAVNAVCYVIWTE